MTAADIKDFGYNSLSELINSQKGFYISYDRNYAYIGNRGFLRSADYNDRNLLLINGHTSNDNVYGSALMESALCLNMNYIDRVEIIRGPGSSIYGTGAMLNVFNIITKKGAGIDGVGVNATYGSFNKREVSALWGKKFRTGLEISVGAIAGKTDGPNLFFKELDSPQTNNGISKGMDWEKLYGIYSTIGYKNFNLNASFTNREKGIPTGAWDSDLFGDNMSKDRRYFFEAKYSIINNNDFKINIRSFIDGYLYKGTYPINGFSFFDESKGNWAGSEAQAFLKIKDHSIVTGGVEYKYNWHATYDEWDEEQEYAQISQKYSVLSVYFQDEISILKNVKLTSGLRIDRYSNVKPALTPRLSLIYNYKMNSSVKLLYGQAFRAPNLYETLYESVDEQKANPDLKPERIIMDELAVEHQFSRILAGSVSVYHYSLKNLIDLYLDENDGLTQFRNVGKTTGNGIETALRLITRRTKGYFSFSIQKTNNYLTEQELTNSPRVILKTGVSQQLFPFLKIAPELFFESGRLTIYDTKTSPVFFANINLNSKKFFNRYDISFKIRNLFNQKYSYPGGYEHIQNSIIQDGINFSVQLNASF